MKAISKEKIDALPKFGIYGLVGALDKPTTVIKVDEIRALYDNAPSVGGVPVYQMLEYSANSWYEVSADYYNSNPYNSKKRKLYTTPQPDLTVKVAELESTIKSYNEFLASGEPENYRAKISALEAKLKEHEADVKIGRLVKSKMKSGNCIPVSRCVITSDEIDQAMKG